jgi:APA family basic amino acid/polyamine antiporter
VLVGALVAVTATLFPADKLEEMVNVGPLFAFLLVSAGVANCRPECVKMCCFVII